MAFDLIPGNQEILAILAEAIDGPYRFIHAVNHHGYVGVGPASADIPLTIHATGSLQLQAQQTTRRLQGLGDSLTFIVMLEGADAARLVEISSSVADPRRATHRRIEPEHVFSAMPLPQPRPRRAPQTPLPVIPAPASRPRSPMTLVTPPKPASHDVPERWAAIQRAADVQPDLLDYVIIPST